MPGPAGLKENVGAPLGGKSEHHQDRRGVKKTTLLGQDKATHTPVLTDAQKKKNRAAFGFADAPLTKGQKAKAEAAARLKAEPSLSLSPHDARRGRKKTNTGKGGKITSRADIQEVGAPTRSGGAPSASKEYQAKLAACKTDRCRRLMSSK